jgi:hypothetical protein
MAKMVLVSTSGVPLVIGQRVETFRGEIGALLGWQEPRHAGSTGRVTVRLDGAEWVGEWYPSVIGAEWVEADAVAEAPGGGYNWHAAEVRRRRLEEAE